MILALLGKEGSICVIVILFLERETTGEGREKSLVVT